MQIETILITAQFHTNTHEYQTSVVYEYFSFSGVEQVCFDIFSYSFQIIYELQSYIFVIKFSYAIKNIVIYVCFSFVLKIDLKSNDTFSQIISK